ncbi:NosR/NirI family protein [Suttonella ornithocola]|nr:NosR/NirI family protein [Suttonella ornithocola]
MASQTAYLSKSQTLEEFLHDVPAQTFFPEATGYGEVQEKPHLVPVMKGTTQIGYVFLNSDYVNAGGYSGKPIKILIGVDNQFTIRALKLVKHSEPIVLIGIPEKKINAFIDSYLGRNYTQGNKAGVPDVITGATVTVMVINETIARSSLLFSRAVRSEQGEQTQVIAQTPDVPKTLLEYQKDAPAAGDWAQMLKEGDVAHLHLTVGEVNEAFATAGKKDAAGISESDDPNATFIDLYVAEVSIPQIGRPLLGEALYQQASKYLKEGETLILVAGKGLYSFKGSGYVRGGIFDRVKIEQDGEGFHFRDRNHRRIGDIMIGGAPKFPEIALFTVPADKNFNALKPWTLDLLAHRAVGPTKKEFIEFKLPYQLPERLLKEAPNPDYQPPKPATVKAETEKSESISSSEMTAGNQTVDAVDEEMPTPLWQRLWQAKTVQIIVLAVALLILTLVFFFQDFLAQHPKFYKKFRVIYLCFTLFWLGGYMTAQLSIVNVFAFTHALMTGFDWSYFLMDPMIFMLWAATAASALLWNRGAFCGWLCPFGALQELTNNLAKKLGVKQFKLPFKVHERMTAIKYLIFMLLFGFSLYDLGLAEKLAEIEPFKASIILKFARAWPYVEFALVLLIIGLFIERFYCRYLCPLGAALAIPAKLRLFDWLKRYPTCGNPCQKCAQECPVEAIFPEGNINANECIQCLNCQVLYHDKKRCMHLLEEIKKQQKYAARAKRDRERLAALQGEATE